MIRLRPIKNKISKILGHERDLKSSAIETVVEQGQEIEKHRTPVHLPGQLEKASQATFGHQSLENEIHEAIKAELIHKPVVRHTLKNCLVHPSGVDFLSGSFRIDELKILPLAAAKIRRIPKALYCMTGASHRFFGHWLQDACATALLQRENEALLLAEPREWAHASQYVHAFGFCPEPAGVLQVDRLTIYEDIGQGSHKRLRYKELRDRLERSYPRSAGGSRRVYFRRGATGAARLVSNENDVICALENRGFEVFDVEHASVEDLATRFRNVDCVVSVDGSHLNHLYFIMAEHTKIITLVPSDRFTMNQVGYCASANINYGFLLMDPVSGKYNVSIDELNSTLDLMLV